jgi:uncharacterized membrane protein YkvA (DUF1232 family)
MPFLLVPMNDAQADGFPFDASCLRATVDPMSEIAEFVAHGGERVTPLSLDHLLHKLPLLKLEFAQINAPKFPHLVDQLNFLADVVEDFAEGADKTIPYVTAAEAVFALQYAHKHHDLIPDGIPGLGRADDSSVVRAVLIRHEGPLSRYADAHHIPWSTITQKP